MKVEPLERAIASLKQRAGGPVRTIYLSPQGERLQQRKVEALAREERLIFVAGRYEGIDERDDRCIGRRTDFARRFRADRW